MASMNYFDSSRKNLTYNLKWKSVMEMHVTSNNKIHQPSQWSQWYSCWIFYDGDAIKLLIFSNLMAF